MLLLFLSSTINAVENDYGIVHTWIKFRDGDWQDTGVDDVTLKVHEPFELKVTIETKVECNVYLEIGGPGITKTYETVEGPSEMGTGKAADYIDNYDCPIGWNQTYEWTVRPTGNWTQGTAPLNLQVFFTTPDGDGKTALGLINAYVSPEGWEDATDGANGNSDITSGQHTPGFEGVILLVLLAVVVMLKRKHDI